MRKFEATKPRDSLISPSTSSDFWHRSVDGSMFKTNPVSLKELLDDTESGKIQLPDFQRGWVWDDDRIRGLLASISRGFPVGAVMTLEAVGEIRLKPRMIEGTGGKGANAIEAYLLDGQQRLTSLFHTLMPA